MVQRDEGSRNGKRLNGADRKQQSPPAFVNHFAKYMESKVSYAEALRVGHTNQETHRPLPAEGGCGAITAVPSQSDGNLSRSSSTPSFDSSVPSAPSLHHSISSPRLESQDFPVENKSLSRHDSPNSSSSSSSSSSVSAKSTSKPSSASVNALYFGKLKSCLSLPKSFPLQYSSTCTGRPRSPPRTSNSDILGEELQRLIKRAIESGSLHRQCASCGNSKHCCGQTILEQLSANTTTS